MLNKLRNNMGILIVAALAVVIIIFLFINQRSITASNKELKEIINVINQDNKELRKTNDNILYKIKMVDKEISKARKTIDSLKLIDQAYKQELNKIRGKYNKYNSNELKQKIDSAFNDPRNADSANKPIDRASDN